ncbi:hypothetical protein Acy02nite_88540 [Actinoplanes cyaneus]|uniref:Leucine rich repeat variant n=1 Tax=Actinoplanes cyaneus TaxID=52696 RepID=A0A919MAX2_9ACTN|nr:hypothetical protein [Actinoplanes cyaneus]MCW2144207.1 hypothetical protein [Actinoplanes cyaneus]GID70973.1 hypothetical protein Acy02nite_88540 [Actinoplanes cyaneus]
MYAGRARPRSLSEQRRWPRFPPPDAVLEGLAVNPALPDDLLLRLIRVHGGPAATGLAERRPLPAVAVAGMAAHPDPWVRAALGANGAGGAEVRLRLLGDPDPYVRRQVEPDPRDGTTVEPAGPGRPRSLSDLNGSRGYDRAAILRGPLDDELLAWVLAEGDEYDLTDLAHNPHLPPAAGLARFAEDFRPHARLLAARDPEVGPGVLMRLLGDPDDAVRWAVARSPHLPVREIVALLDDPELRGSAAANPALPVAEMARRIGSPDVAVAPVADDGVRFVE